MMSGTKPHIISPWRLTAQLAVIGFIRREVMTRRFQSHHPGGLIRPMRVVTPVACRLTSEPTLLQPATTARLIKPATCRNGRKKFFTRPTGGCAAGRGLTTSFILNQPTWSSTPRITTRKRLASGWRGRPNHNELSSCTKLCLICDKVSYCLQLLWIAADGRVADQDV